MSPIPTINLMRPITAVCVVPDGPGGVARTEGLGAGPAECERDHRQAALEEITRRPSLAEDLQKELQEQRDELVRLLAALNGITDSLHRLHEQIVANHPAEIAKLAVEIARRILMHKVGQGDYEIQAIVEGTLKEAPACQDLVVHLNPDDLAPCQELQRQNPQSPFAGLELTADRTIGRGECLVETPKGIVKSFMEEHLERISEALQRVR